MRTRKSIFCYSIFSLFTAMTAGCDASLLDRKNLSHFDPEELKYEAPVSRSQLGEIRNALGFDLKKKKCWARALVGDAGTKNFYTDRGDISVLDDKNSTSTKRVFQDNKPWSGSVFVLFIPGINKFYGYVSPMSTSGPKTNYMSGNIHVLEWNNKEFYPLNPALHFSPPKIGLPDTSELKKFNSISGEFISVGDQDRVFYINVDSTWFSTNGPSDWKERVDRKEYFPCVATI